MFRRTLLCYLERYLLTRGSVDLTDPLFVSQKGNRLNRQALWESFHAKQSRAGLKSGIHILRHTLVSAVDHNGGSAIARDIAGHSSVQITDVYMHTNIEERKDALNNLPYLDKLESAI